MAARRLIIVLLVLFAISIAAAAIAPKRPGGLGSDEPTSTSTSSTTEDSGPTGATVDATIAASAEKPPQVEAGVGDQLALAVATKDVTQVEIADLGLLEDATPEAPALFDILLREAGEIEITDALTDEVIGRLVVGAGGAGKDSGPQQPAPGSPNSGNGP